MKLAAVLAQRVHHVVHVHGHADRARLVRDGARDRLADPPCGVGGQAEPKRRVVLLGGLHQPNRPLLNQVLQREALVHVLLGNGHYEAERAASPRPPTCTAVRRPSAPDAAPTLAAWAAARAPLQAPPQPRSIAGASAQRARADSPPRGVAAAACQWSADTSASSPPQAAWRGQASQLRRLQRASAQVPTAAVPHSHRGAL
eukprot:scaffold5393_cov129-Isochrysis_galbana.AAC.2